MSKFWCAVRWVIFLAMVAGAYFSFKWLIAVDCPNKNLKVWFGMGASFLLVATVGKMIYCENLFVTFLGWLTIVFTIWACIMSISVATAVVALLLSITAYIILFIVDSTFRTRVIPSVTCWFTINSDEPVSILASPAPPKAP